MTTGFQRNGFQFGGFQIAAVGWFPEWNPRRDRFNAILAAQRAGKLNPESIDYEAEEEEEEKQKKMTEAWYEAHIAAIVARRKKR